MSKELVIGSNRHETRVALIEDDQLVEVYFQRANEYSLAGSIHKGRVTRVLPGMQSAFVDLGLERDTFLYVSDFLEEHEDIDRVTGNEPPPRERRPPQPQQHPPAAQAVPAAEEGTAPAAVEGAAPPSQPHAGGEGRGERPDDRGGDRRGRRSRRRRNRGRGIPDSKYAHEGPPRPVESAPAAQAEPEAGVEAGGESLPPIILPGESLAKYRAGDRGGDRGAAPETAPEIPVNGTSHEAAVHEALTAEPEAAGAEQEDDVENEYDEPIHYPPENALPDSPAHPNAGVTAAPVSEPVAEVAPPVIESETEEEEETEAEAAADEAPAVAPMLDEEEDRDIQEMILN